MTEQNLNIYIYFETWSALSKEIKPFVLCSFVFKLISFLMHNKFANYIIQGCNVILVSFVSH